MKKTILTLVAIFMASTSNALVADRFKCSIEIKDFNSKNSSKQEKEFFIARLPTSPIQPPGTNPNPNVRLTAGQTMERMTLDTPDAKFVANLNFYFKHAVRSGANGSLEARQLTCIGLTADYCKHVSGNGIGVCREGTVSCKESTNPFDPNNGWAQTTMFGPIPTFDEQALAPTSRNITDDNGNIVGVVNLSCQYLGSFN
jgi:hypothetical protein